MSTDKIWAKLDKEFGGSVLSRADEAMKMNVEVVPFPSPWLNDAVGFGGLPLGRISQFHGPEGCGKTFSQTGNVAFDLPFNHSSPTLRVSLGKCYAIRASS